VKISGNATLKLNVVCRLNSEYAIIGPLPGQ
jgi:hypothetical protein